MPKIAIVVFDGVEELDFVGPWEVLSAWASQHPDDGVEVFTVGWTEADPPAPITCAKRLRVIPDRPRTGLASADVVLVPGGKGTRPLMDDAALLAALRGADARQATITSVCTGSLLLAAAGLLDGRPATTHWSALDRLAAAGTSIEVRPDDRFVVSDRIVTAAGVSAGIDMALHLVAQLASVERAREVRRYNPVRPGASGVTVLGPAKTELVDVLPMVGA